MSDNRGQLLTPGSGRGARLAGPRWPESAGKAVSRNARHLDFVVPVAQPFTFPSLSSFEEAFEEALVASAAAEGLSLPTVAGVRYSLRRLTDFIRGRRLERAFLSGQLPEQARALEVWLGSLRAGGANHTTVNYYWRMLHAGLKRLGARTGMAEPTQFLPVPRPGRPLPRFLSRTDLEAVLRAAANYQWPRGPFERHRSVAIIAMMGLGGLRRGEVLRLEVRDIDLTQGAVTVRHGKGRSGGKDRVVFMPPGLRTALSSYLDVRAARPGSTGRLFISTRGTRPIGVTTIRRLCRTLQEVSGVAVAPHMLRHTCATLLRQAGIPDRLAMEQLGHASLGVLQRYSHVTDEERRQIVGRLDIDLLT